MNKRKLKYSYTKVLNAVENLRCEELHHKKSHQHEHGVTCPVEYELQQHAFIIRDNINALEQAKTMLKVFKSCIETGVYPEKDSPCAKKIDGILNT